MVEQVFADARRAGAVELHRGDECAVVGDEEVAVHRREHADEQRGRDAERKAERHERARGRGLAVKQHRGDEQAEWRRSTARPSPCSLRPPIIVSWFALMNVSPSHASPRMPMIAVTPDWHVLHLGTSATGAFVTVRMIAATASMTMAMAMGIERMSGFSGSRDSPQRRENARQHDQRTPAEEDERAGLRARFRGVLASRPAARWTPPRPMPAAVDTRDRL